MNVLMKLGISRVFATSTALSSAAFHDIFGGFFSDRKMREEGRTSEDAAPLLSLLTIAAIIILRQIRNKRPTPPLPTLLLLKQ
jgi:hypothetical protein